MRLSIIIPHNGDPAALTGCLTALSMQKVLADEIVVVTNGKVDSSCEVIRMLRALHLLGTAVHETQTGAGAARNAGVARSSGEWLAFVDSDCTPALDWVASGRRALELNPVFGGIVKVTAGRAGRPTPTELFDITFGFDAQRFFKRAGHLLTTNLFCTREAFEKVGPFRCLVPEDKEWSWRAHAVGLTLTVKSDVVVEHPALSTWSQLAYRWQRMTKEEYRLSRERQRGQLYFWLRSLLILASIAPHSLRLLHNSEFRLEVVLRAILVLTRVRLYRFALAQKLVTLELLNRFRKLRADLGRHSWRGQ